MREIQNEAKYYMENKVFGAYETTDTIENNQFHIFKDSKIEISDASHTSERYMDIEGKIYKIHSIFPTEDIVSVSDKLIEIIGNDLSK
ncbi:MAG: hypothetical protein R3Y35_03090 [Clostridia bacterium]